MKTNSHPLAPMVACILFVLGFSTKDTEDSGREVDEKNAIVLLKKRTKKTPTFRLVLSYYKKTINNYSIISVWFLKTNSPSNASKRMMLSVAILPARISLDNLFRTSLCITRFTGLAPNCGSNPFSAK